MSVQSRSNFNFMERFGVIILKKKNITLREHPKFFIVKSKEKGSEISLIKDLIDMKARNNHCVSVLKPYLCVLVCLLRELH